MTEDLGQALIGSRFGYDKFSGNCEKKLPEVELSSVLRDLHRTDKVIRGHNKKVTTVAVIDSDFIVSASKDQRVKVWSVGETGSVANFRGHEGKVNMVAVGLHEVDNGKLVSAEIYSASDDKTIKRWKTHSQSEVLTYIGHTDSVLCLDYDYTTKRLASGGADKRIIIWSRDRADIDFYLSELKDPEVQFPESHEDKVNSIKFFDYGRKLASGSNDKRVKVWNLESKSFTQSLVNQVEIRNLVFSTEEHDGDVLVLDTFANVIASGTSSGSIYIWRWNILINKLSLNQEFRVLALKFSHNGKFLISNEEENYLSFWNLDKSLRETRIFVSNERINALALSRDSSFVVSGSDDNCVAVWQTKRSLELVTFKEHIKAVTSLSVSSSQNLVITGSADHTLHLWNPSSPSQSTKLGDHQDQITCISTQNDHCLSGCHSNTIKLWNLKNHSLTTQAQFSQTPKSLNLDCRCTYAVVGFKADKQTKTGKILLLNGTNLKKATSFKVQKSVNSVIFLQNSVLTIAAGTSAGEVHIFDINHTHRVAQVHQLKITSIKSNETKGLLYTSSVDCTVKVLKINDLTVKATLDNFCKVNSIDVGFQGNLLIAGLDDGLVRVWNLKDLREEFSLKMHEAPVLAVGFSFKDRFIVSGSADSNAKLWATREKNKQKVVKRLHSRSITCIAATNDGKYGISASEDGLLKTWFVHSQEVTNTFEVHRKKSSALNEFLSLAVSADGLRAIVGCSDKRIYVYPIDHAPQKSFLKVLQGHVGEVTGLVVANDNDTLYSCSKDGTIRKWSIAKGQELNYMYASEHDLTALALSHSGSYIYSGDSSGRFKVFNSTRFTETHSRSLSPQALTSIQITKDDTLALISSKSGKLHIHNIHSNHPVYSIHLHKSAITCLALSPCSKYIYSGSEDSSIKIWNIEEQYEEFQIKAHNESITCLHINPTSNLLLSGSKDESISIWHHKARFQVKKLTGHDRQIFTIASSSNLIATGSADESIIIWTYKTMAIKYRVKDLPDRVLSLAFALNERILYIGLANGDIFACDLNQDIKISRIACHEEAVTCLVQHQDGRLISGSSDHRVVVWDLQTDFKVLHSFNEHQAKVTTFAYCGAVD